MRISLAGNRSPSACAAASACKNASTVRIASCLGSHTLEPLRLRRRRGSSHDDGGQAAISLTWQRGA